jgi:rubrerythrin
MKKLISVLLSLMVVTLFMSACTHNKVYGTVVVSPEKYKQISSDKKLIKKTISGLEKFNSENPETEKSVIRSLNALITKGQKKMNSADRAEFKALLGNNKNGVKGIVKKAYKHQRGFDDDLSSRIRSNMLKSIKLMTHGITKNENERKKIYKQVLKDTKSDKNLYKIGGNE